MDKYKKENIKILNRFIQEVQSDVNPSRLQRMNPLSAYNRNKQSVKNWLIDEYNKKENGEVYPLELLTRSESVETRLKAWIKERIEPLDGGYQNRLKENKRLVKGDIYDHQSQTTAGSALTSMNGYHVNGILDKNLSIDSEAPLFTKYIDPLKGKQRESALRRMEEFTGQQAANVLKFADSYLKVNKLSKFPPEFFAEKGDKANILKGAKNFPETMIAIKTFLNNAGKKYNNDKSFVEISSKINNALYAFKEEDFKSKDAQIQSGFINLTSKMSLLGFSQKEIASFLAENDSKVLLNCVENHELVGEVAKLLNDKELKLIDKKTFGKDDKSRLIKVFKQALTFDNIELSEKFVEETIKAIKEENSKIDQNQKFGKSSAKNKKFDEILKEKISKYEHEDKTLSDEKNRVLREELTSEKSKSQYQALPVSKEQKERSDSHAQRIREQQRTSSSRSTERS